VLISNCNCNAKSRASSDRSPQSTEIGPENRAGGEKALDPAPATAPTGDAPRPYSASAEASPNSRPSENAAEPGAVRPIVLAPSARTDWISASAPDDPPLERMGIGFDGRQGSALVENRPLILEPTAGAKDLPPTGPSASSLRIGEEREEGSPAAGPSPHDPVAEPGAAVASPLYPDPVVPYDGARMSKRSPLSAFAKDVLLISTVVPAMQPPMSASGEGAGPSGDRRAWGPSGASFQLPTAWLSQSSGERPAASVAEPEIEASKPSAEGEDRGPAKAEPERKSQFWQRLVQTQAAGGPEEAAGQSKLLKAFQQLVGGTPETPAERAYAALLQEGVRGPARLRIGDRATFSLPFGYVFLDNFGVILPSTRAPTWMAYVDLIERGHIKEDDARALAPSTLLAALSTAAAAQNVERGRNGLAPLIVSDWIAAPKYLPPKHSLSSCLSAVDGAFPDSQARLVNCASLLLGRRGAIEILVVGALSNLVSFEREAAALGEKIAYDPEAAYESYVRGVYDEAGYGLVALAGGIIGLKGVAAPVAAAGADRAQDLLLYRILGYWQAILTALIAAALGTYWFLRNRPRGAQEAEASRPAVQMPYWKSVLWAARSGLNRLFDKGPARSRLVEARVDSAEKTRPSPMARPKVRFSVWAETLVAKFSIRKSPLESYNEKNADLQAEIDAEAKTAPVERAKSILTSARQAKRDTASTPASGSADDASQAGAFATGGVAANAGDLTRFATLMRRKDKVPTPESGFGEGAGSSRESRVKPEEAPVEAEKRGAVDLFDLVEPGDREAVSMAVSKREALHKAQG
jgi:uncharacterized membrane-anchored protein